MTKSTFSLRNYVNADSGVAAIEFVFLLPFLLFLFFGMVDLTGLIGTNRKVTQSASVVADLVAQNRNAFLRPATTDYYKAVKMIMEPTSMSDVRVEIHAFRPSGGAVAETWSTNNGQGPSCGPPPPNSSLVPLASAGNDLIMARVCTLFEPYMATFIGTKVLGKTSFLVEETITLRPRSSSQLNCFQTTMGGAGCT
jgi:TadE-like protein